MICSYLFRIRSSKCSTLPDINHTNPAAHRYKPQDKASKVIAVPGSRHHGEFGSWPCGHFWRQSCLRCAEIFSEKMEIYGNIRKCHCNHESSKSNPQLFKFVLQSCCWERRHPIFSTILVTCDCYDDLRAAAFEENFVAVSIPTLMLLKCSILDLFKSEFGTLASGLASLTRLACWSAASCWPVWFMCCSSAKV